MQNRDILERIPNMLRTQVKATEFDMAIFSSNCGTIDCAIGWAIRLFLS